jgi:tripartite-type tricarboxylate transporter receptor subunit TctC
LICRDAIKAGADSKTAISPDHRRVLCVGEAVGGERGDGFCVFQNTGVDRRGRPVRARPPSGRADADGVADFYKGKNVQLIIATGTGASYDFFGRLVARHMPRYVPGNPTMVPQNMPGASGFRAANQLYAVSPKDGTVLATFNNAIAFYQAMRQPGIQYKAEELTWIGGIPQDTPLVAVWHTTGVRTIEDAKKIEVVMGATGAGGNFAGHPALLNSVLGTRFKIVTGYDGGGALNLAIERGEVSGKANTTWAAFKTITPEWVRDGKIVPLVQFGPVKDPNLPNVPLLTQLATNDEQRRMFAFVVSTVELGQPFAAPPRIPDDRTRALRTAFEQTVMDAEFRKDAEKLAAEVEMKPIAGAEVAGIVRRTVETPAALVDKVRAAMEVKGAKAGAE